MTLSTSHSEFASLPASFPLGNGAPIAASVDSSGGMERKKSLRALPLHPSTRVWGIDYSVVTMEQSLEFIDVLIHRREPHYAITANLNYAMLCDSSPRLAAFTDHCKLVLCDGMPIYWRSKLNKQKLPERVAGADLIYELAHRSALRGYRMFLMGGDEGVAQQAADKLRELNPQLTIAGVECPPFRKLTEEEYDQLCGRIRAAKPDILLVAFGQPKGEFWIEENYQSLGVPFSIQLGASFDFIVGKARRAPVWMQKIGMEWLFRSLSDPRRLLPRYFKNGLYLLKAIRRDLLDATQVSDL
jgi:N-acetylglucosaminyldiphosphoundecaprenol N-acetyl-beta-D-mannosaminyltransferase